MARMKPSWLGLEDIEVNAARPVDETFDNPDVPEVIPFGPMAADMSAPADGSLFEDPRVTTNETTPLEMPAPAHEEIITDASKIPEIDDNAGTVPSPSEQGVTPDTNVDPDLEVVPDATSLHADDEEAKVDAAATPDSDNNDEEYTPPPAPVVEPTEDADEAEGDLEDTTADDPDALDDTATADDEERLDDDLNSDDAEESDDDDIDPGNDKDTDFGDSDMVDSSADKVETDEASVDAADAADEDMSDIQSDIDDDKEELAALKNVATESLQGGGMSHAAAAIYTGRVNAICSKYGIDIPTMPTVATENFESSINRYQNTVQLISINQIAQEGLGEVVKSWFGSKMKTLSNYLGSIGAYGKTAVEDAERKLAKINTLAPDWESKDITVTKAMRNLVKPTDPLAVARLSRKALTLNFEGMAKKASTSGLAGIRGLDGSGWVAAPADAPISGIGSSPKCCHIGANSYIYEGVYHWDKDQAFPTAYAINGNKFSDEKTANSVGKRELIEIIEAYRDLGALIVKNQNSILKESESFKSANDALTQAFASGDSDAIAKHWKEQTYSAAVLVGYYRAVTNTCRALKDAASEYLKNPKKD